MCTIMLVDSNELNRIWICECIAKSELKTANIIVCNSVVVAENYIRKKNVDIVIARIEKEDLHKLEFIKALHKKYLFSIVLAYGTYNDFNFLCKIVSSGVSIYLQDVFDKYELNNFLNEAYERYLFIKLKLNSIAEKDKGNKEKAYTFLMLTQFVIGYVKKAETSYEKNVDEYIDLILDVMDYQKLHHSKSMVIELMIILAERADKGLIRTDRTLINSKYCGLITKAKTTVELKKITERYLKNLAMNIYLLSSTNDYKSLIIITAIKYIKSNYHNDISRDDVASVVSLNPSYFSKFFKEQTGESFVSYLRRIRLDKARSILEITDETIKVVSERVGYSDSKYFSRIFYEHIGTTPYQYRKSVTKIMA